MPAIVPVATKGGGQAMAFPDVCKVPAPPAPPIPTPFPNSANLAQATATSTKVKFSGNPVFLTSSEIPRSMGDEAGTLFGMKSNTNMGACICQSMTCAKLKVEGKKVAHQGTMTGQNCMGKNFNIVGAFVMVSNMKVLSSL